MGWVTEDGLHEGWMAAEFADGTIAAGISGGGVPDDQIIIEQQWDEQTRSWRYTTRPAAEVIGWRIRCDCRYEFGNRGLIPEAERWRSDLLPRVPSNALEDIAEGGIYAADEDIPGVTTREDVDTLVQDRWWREHAGGQEALARVQHARKQFAAIEQELANAVAIARAAGASWDAIGRAVGISRQSAHERWRRLDPVTAGKDGSG